MIASTTQLNTPGPLLAELPGVHAITDVTGFGLAGHALEMARGAAASLQLDWACVPLLPGVAELAAAGCLTGASARNWAGYGADVQLAAQLPALAQSLLTDPQTSGGLLVACAPDSAAAVLEIFAREGFEQAAVIGQVQAGRPGLQVRAAGR